jgi:hypothetical protein
VAYGGTGTGKSHLLCGDLTCVEGRGLIPRALAHIFSQLNGGGGESGCASVHVTYVDVRGENVTDLLRAGALVGGVAIHDAAADDLGNCGGSAFPYRHSLRGATRVRVADEEAAFGLMLAAEANRAAAAAERGVAPDQGTTVFTLHLDIPRRGGGGGGGGVSSKLHFVECAAAERAAARKGGPDPCALAGTAPELDQLLAVLGSRSTAETGGARCGLTRLLRDSVGAAAATVVVATCSGESARHVEQTARTCAAVRRVAAAASAAAAADANANSAPTAALSRQRSSGRLEPHPTTSTSFSKVFTTRQWRQTTLIETGPCPPPRLPASSFVSQAESQAVYTARLTKGKRGTTRAASATGGRRVGSALRCGSASVDDEVAAAAAATSSAATTSAARGAAPWLARQPPTGPQRPASTLGFCNDDDEYKPRSPLPATPASPVTPAAAAPSSAAGASASSGSRPSIPRLALGGITTPSAGGVSSSGGGGAAAVARRGSRLSSVGHSMAREASRSGGAGAASTSTSASTSGRKAWGSYSGVSPAGCDAAMRPLDLCGGGGGGSGGGGGGGGRTASGSPAPGVGPARYCPPRHRHVCLHPRFLS